MGRRSELAAPWTADRAAHRVLPRVAASRAPQRHLRRRLAAAQRIRSGQLGTVRHSGGGHRAGPRGAVVAGGDPRAATPRGTGRRAHRGRAPHRGGRPLRRACRCAVRRTSAPSHARMNEMSSRLEAEETRRRSVLADIAHELRTPLSIIRGQAEAITDGIYPADAEHMAPIVSATESLEMLVNDLEHPDPARRAARCAFTASRSMSRSSSTRRSTRSVPRREPPASSSPSASMPALPPIDADPGRLRGVLGNLVSNALAHEHARRHHPRRGRQRRSMGAAHRPRRRNRASPPTCCRGSSTVSSRARRQPDRGSGSRSFGTWWRRTVVRSSATSTAADGTAITPEAPDGRRRDDVVQVPPR